MARLNTRKLETELVRYYASERDTEQPDRIDSLVDVMLAEDARVRSVQGRRLGMPAFVAAQVRFIPAWTWAAQAAVVAFMGVVAAASDGTIVTALAVGVLSAMTVLVGVPTLHASKLHGVAELEYSCANNAAAVLAARLVALGCSSALAVVLMVAVASSALDVSAFAVALWACPPFFASCAGVLVLLRKAPPSAAALLCAAWVASCSMALVAVSAALPEAYGVGSLAVWAGAAALALVWLARETALICRAATSGLDAFSPQSAMTYN